MNDNDRTFCESFTTTVMILPNKFLLVNYYPQHNDLCCSSSKKINLVVYPQQNQFCCLLNTTESISSNSHNINHYYIYEKFILQENIPTNNYTVD